MVRSIVDTLRHLEAGCLIDDASVALTEIVKAVESTGKAGSLTIKIDVRKATAGAMAIRGSYTMKKPAEPPIESLMFPTPEGNLLTEDPNQKKLDLRQVSQGGVTLKVKDGAGQLEGEPQGQEQAATG